MKRSIVLLGATALVGCASGPPVYSPQQVRSLGDKELCLSGLGLTPNHPSFRSIEDEYQRRLQAKRFTHEQCKSAQEAKRKSDQAEFNAAASALLSPTAEAYAAGKLTPRPTYTPAAERKTTVYLQNQWTNNTNRYCAYSYGHVITLSTTEICPQWVSK
jgi:hypothetical protein